MKKPKSKTQNFIIINLITIFVLLFALEAKAEGWRFWEAKGICEKLVDPIINESLSSLAPKITDKKYADIKKKEVTHAQNECYRSILKTGNYKELYAYYLFYKYSDDALRVANKGSDKAPNNIYHYMLFYTNQNSRNFNEKTQSFEKEQGLYEEELRTFEDNMTQEEKIKSFSYIADNLATGKEGWVKINDYQKSFEYLKRAAEAGDPRSQSKLAECYILGSDWMKKILLQKDNILAYKWTYLSTLHSTQRSWEYNYIKNERVKTLKHMMTPEQIQQAKQQAQIWLDQNKEFIKNHPLKITSMTKEEVAAERAKTKKFIKDYGLDKPLSKDQINNNTSTNQQ